MISLTHSMRLKEIYRLRVIGRWRMKEEAAMSNYMKDAETMITRPML